MEAMQLHKISKENPNELSKIERRWDFGIRGSFVAPQLIRKPFASTSWKVHLPAEEFTKWLQQ